MNTAYKRINKFLSLSLSIVALLILQAAQANVEVSFVESAPKDLFVFKNTGKCNLENVSIELDLSKSDGRLIFDTTATGAGVEVFQPFEVTEGSIALNSQAIVKDGDSKLSLIIAKLTPGKSASFTIDVDDTLPKSELGKIRVADSEIKNGLVRLNSAKQNSVSAIFGTDSKAVVMLRPCPIS